MKIYQRYGKSFLDFTGSLLIALLLCWLFLVIVFAYLLSFQWPILYKAKRLGKSKNPFVMYKFRTLGSDETQSLPQRRFGLGDILRASNLDELPQLWNVLKGEMSLIGPRPLPVEYLPLFSEEQKKRLEVKPGITGWAQVNGRHSIPWKEKLELDNYYVDHVSLKLDLMIIMKTVSLLLSFKKDRSLEEEKFKGTN